LGDNGKPQFLEMGVTASASPPPAAAIESKTTMHAASHLATNDHPSLWCCAPSARPPVPEVKARCRALTTLVLAAGDVILDDRNERPGACLLTGTHRRVPHRVTIGDRGLKGSAVPAP
jgi:hypothetical protein